MPFIIFVLSTIFVSVLFGLAKIVVLAQEKLLNQDLERVKEIDENYLKNKEKVIAERAVLEEEAKRIFTLYEMTREINKKFNPEEAFAVFKSKLRENVSQGDCELVRTLPNETKLTSFQEDTFIIAIPDDKEIIGHLVFKGIPAAEKVKALILGHQFILAFRRVNLYQKIERIAITDSLTEVYTRRYFLERFEEEIKRSRLRKIHLSFLMVDVDHFKSFNDQHGHLAGDQILKEVAAVIKASIREIDIAGRYGGEEFCVLLPDTDGKGALFAAERIRVAVEKNPIKAYDTTVNVTVSIGVSTFPTHSLVSNELMDKADWALYRAKKNGRNRVCSFGVYEDPQV